MIFGQEAGEQQPMPMLVSGGGGQMIDFLSALMRIEPVAQSPATGAKTIAQQPLLDGRMRPVILLMNGQILQRGASGGLGPITGGQGHAGQLIAQVFGEGSGHQVGQLAWADKLPTLLLLSGSQAARRCADRLRFGEQPIKHHLFVVPQPVDFGWCQHPRHG